MLIGNMYPPNGNPWPGPKFDISSPGWTGSEHAQALLDSGCRRSSSATSTSFRPTWTFTSPNAGPRTRFFAPEARAKYRELVGQGWTDAIRKLHPEERIYTFWHYWRNSFERDAGIRIDHALLSPEPCYEAQGGGRRPHAARLGEDKRPCPDMGRGRG